MPNIYRTHAIANTPANERDLDNAIVQVTPGTVKFDGLLLNLPFGKKGATNLRVTAKTYGARWNGTDWRIPASKYATLRGTGGGLEWLLQNGVLAGICTRSYDKFLWDGKPVHGLALAVPFEERHVAKSAGAKWDPTHMRWWVPGNLVTQTLIDELNRQEAIEGVLLPNGTLAAAPAPAASTQTPLRAVPEVPAASALFNEVVASIAGAHAAQSSKTRPVLRDNIFRALEHDTAAEVHLHRGDTLFTVAVLKDPYTWQDQVASQAFEASGFVEPVVLLLWPFTMFPHYLSDRTVHQVLTGLGVDGAQTVTMWVMEKSESRAVYERLANHHGLKPLEAAIA